MRSLIRTGLLLLLASLPVRAADVEIGIHHLGMIPMGEQSFEGGELEIVSSRGFAVSAEVFPSERFSVQLAVTFLNPAAILYPDTPPPSDIDLNTLGIDAYSASARFHMAPARRFSPFVGAGVAFVSFGNLEERYDDRLEMRLENQTAFLAETGVRYELLPRLFLDVTACYMPLESGVAVVKNDPGVSLPSQIAIDALSVSAGASWRF